MHEILAPNAIFDPLNIESKKQLLRALSRCAVQCSADKIEEPQIFDALVEREKLGGTGLERGVAIPHAKIDGLSKTLGIFARNMHPIDFEAHDNIPCDLIFVLLVPDNAGQDHLKCLSKVARTFHDKHLCEAIRGAQNAEAIYQILTESLQRAA